jgi:menaquinone-dependent protoporphyrinogen oxidase
MNALVAYSSGLGSTKEVAEEIAKILSENNSINVDLKTVDDVGEIDKYDAVIIGSSVRADRPLANVRDFFARYRHILPKKKIAIFAVCLSANCESGKEKVKDDYLSQITEKYPQLNPVSLGAFGGKIDFDQLNPVMQKLMEKVLDKTGIPQKGSVDTRDWEYIRSWSKDLRDLLTA